MKRLEIVAYALLLVCSAVAATVAPTAPLRKLVPSDFFAVTRLDQPTLSPDGRRLVYVELRPDIMTDKWRGQVFVADPAHPASRRPLPVAKDAREFRWSADGTRVAYVAPGADGDELRVIDVASGRDRALATGLAAAGQLSWSPDGRRDRKSVV